MKYNFICDCGNETTVDIPMREISQTEITCDRCGKKMHQKWCTSFSIPEGMTAEGSQETAWIKERMKNRPSGKRKIYY